MKQKIIKVGNSLGVVLPKKIREELSLKKGESINITSSKDGDYVLISKGDKKPPLLSPKFEKTVKKVNKRYKSALKDLASK